MRVKRFPCGYGGYDCGGKMVYAEGGDRIPSQNARPDVNVGEFISALGGYRGGPQVNYKPMMDRMALERRLAEQGSFVDPGMDFNRMTGGQYANRYNVPQSVRDNAVNYYDDRLNKMRKEAYIQSLIRR